MYRYVKYFDSIIKSLELEPTSKFTAEEIIIFNYICSQLTKNSCVLSIEDATELKSLVTFDLDKYTFCYLKKSCELNELLRFDKTLNETIEFEINQQRTKGARKFDTVLVRKILSKVRGNYINTIYLRRLEKVISISLDDCIVSRYDLATGENKKLTEKRYCNIIYELARILSVTYGFGYKINYDQKTLLVEKNKIILVEVYWIGNKVYCNKEYLFDLNSDVSFISDLLVSYIKNISSEI